MPRPVKIIVHYEDGESLTLDRSTPEFERFYRASQEVVASLNTLLPLLTPREIVRSFQEKSTYVELRFSAPFRVTTGLIIPPEERGRYQIGKDVDEKGRRIIEPDNIIFFLSGDRQDIVLISEPHIENPSAWQGRDLNALRKLVEELRTRKGNQ